MPQGPRLVVYYYCYFTFFRRDENYGLGAPNKGGLYLIDLNKGGKLGTYIEPTVDGVFRREAGELLGAGDYTHHDNDVKLNIAKLFIAKEF